MLLSSVTDEDLTALVRLVGRDSGSALTVVELRQLGGAFARPALAGGAFDGTPARFALVQIGALGGGITDDVHRGMMARVRAALSHRDTGFTLPSLVESTTQASRTFGTDVEVLVERVRRDVDPDGLFAPAVAPFVEA